MIKINMTVQEVSNLLAFLTGKGRVQLTGDEAFEFTNIVHKIQGAEEVFEDEPTGISSENTEESE